MSKAYRIGAILVVCILLVLSVNGGCSLGDQLVELHYTQCVSGQKGEGIVYLVKSLEASIPKKNGSTVVGPIRTGLGTRRADAITNDSVGDWAVFAMKTELTAAGFRPQLVDKLPERCPRGIEIEVRKVWVDEVNGEIEFRMPSTVIVEARLVKDGKTTKGVIVEGQANPTISGRLQKAECLELALQSGMKNAFPEIVSEFK